ncbi:hypothetical protein GCM10010412_019650 [Nonomuraea recticatena]|uniref:Uncharacterized protein n=1 Tax=Nonomuraea recticatena TaxID=46178 RepID=A0ABN3RHS9_9ACTN
MPRLAEATHAEQLWRVQELTGDFAGSRARNLPTPDHRLTREVAFLIAHLVHPALTRRWERAWRPRNQAEAAYEEGKSR